MQIWAKVESFVAPCQCTSPGAICYNPRNDRVFTANYGSSNVTVIDAALNQVVSTVAAGASPFALCYNPTDNKISVIHSNDEMTLFFMNAPPFFFYFARQSAPNVLNQIISRKIF
jgi:YVTN family beta-propeller protein